MQAIKTIPLTEDPFDQLMSDCQQQLPNSQEKLYRYCYPLFINTCLRYSKDLDGAGIIFNNAFLKVFKSIHQYQYRGKARAWIKTIVVHSCIDYFKQKNKIKETEVTAREEEIGAFSEEVIQKLTIKEISRIIRELPPATATVFNLYVFDEYTHAEIAALVGISENTSKWHLNAGRKFVKQRVEALSKL